MHRLSLDYQKSGTILNKAGSALLLIGIAVTLSMMFQFKSAKQELAIAEENTGHLEQQIKRVNGTSPQTTKPSPELQHEVQIANEILLQLSLPWGGLFKTLEASNTDKIALLSIQPDASKHSIKVNGEAKDFTALLEYIEQLEQDKTMTEVALLNHEINQQTPEKPVRFALTANWRLQP